MNTKFIGGILLIVGTSIGAGMLALPVANAALGFWPSSLMLVFCWALMTTGAFFILEVSLCMPPGSHMVSMAYQTLGRSGLIIAWLSYLFLLYTLLSAYISGGADVMASLLALVSIEIKEWQASSLFALGFGMVVYGGILHVDYANRVLMFAKLGVYLLLVILISPYVKPLKLSEGNVQYLGSSLMILITSFGFAIIVPNLRDYFDNDVKTLKKVVFIGSLIPLICYLIWDAIIIGTLPTAGEHSLASLRFDEHTTSSLAKMLSATVHNPMISNFFQFFTSVCMLTAFLGVSLCLNTFLADGLKMTQKGKEGKLLFLLTFCPPLSIVIFYPGAYIHALSYAGFFCVILLLLLPTFMSYYGRKKLSPQFIVPAHGVSHTLVIVLSLIILIYSVLEGSF